MAPTLSGTLSLFTAPPAPRIPKSIDNSGARDVNNSSGSSRKYPYFTSGDLESKKAVIFLGGLTNGMGAVPYVHKLSEELQTAGWRLYVFLTEGMEGADETDYSLIGHRHTMVTVRVVWTRTYLRWELWWIIYVQRTVRALHHADIPELIKRHTDSSNHGPLYRIPRRNPLPHIPLLDTTPKSRRRYNASSSF
jgi:hypothetical protein